MEKNNWQNNRLKPNHTRTPLNVNGLNTSVKAGQIAYKKHTYV